MACGTKSIGQKFMRNDGLHLNDCHAEVLARRGLILQLQREWEVYFERVGQEEAEEGQNGGEEDRIGEEGGDGKNSGDEEEDINLKDGN